MELELTESDQSALLWLARQSIELGASGGRLSEALGAFEPTSVMRVIAPCFVTLRIDGELRGCIGALSADEPLFMNVAFMAQRAAFNDPRFAPVSLGEVRDLAIEISVLSPQRPVDSYEAIEVGRHGVVLEKGMRRAVFLPDVATQFGWDRETLLNHLARKAGLPIDAWRQGASFEVFTTVKFKEPVDADEEA